MVPESFSTQQKIFFIVKVQAALYSLLLINNKHYLWSSPKVFAIVFPLLLVLLSLLFSFYTANRATLSEMSQDYFKLLSTLLTSMLGVGVLASLFFPNFMSCYI
jgi:hypothetical protein